MITKNSMTCEPNGVSEELKKRIIPQASDAEELEVYEEYEEVEN